MTQQRKSKFLESLRTGLSLRRAARQASACAATLEGAEASFRQAARRDREFALQIAKTVHGR